MIAETSRGRLLLLDTASLYYRAFFGIPDRFFAPDGTSVNAVRGMVGFIAQLVRTGALDSLVACWDDDWRPAWRVELLDSYKAHRVADTATGSEETPEALAPQVAIIREALQLLGVPVIGATAAEADDIIGTLATAWPGASVDIVTGDRDLFQLIDDRRRVRVLYTARGVSQLDEFDEARLADKYGIAAQRYVDFAVLRGDPSDGLPGVKGIGEKTAAALVRDHGDLDAIAAAADDGASALKPGVRRALLESKDYLQAARRVVAVRTDLELPEPARLAGPPDLHAWHDFAETWNLGHAAVAATTALTELRR